MTQYLITEAQRGLLEDLCCRGPRPLWEMVRDLEPVKPLTAAEQGWNAALDQAAAIVLADCVNPPKTEYQHQYNATLRHTAAQILKLKEST